MFKNFVRDIDSKKNHFLIQGTACFYLIAVEKFCYIIISILPFPCFYLPCPSFMNFLWMAQESCNPLMRLQIIFFLIRSFGKSETRPGLIRKQYGWRKKLPNEIAKLRVQQNKVFHCFNCTILITDRSYNSCIS